MAEVSSEIGVNELVDGILVDSGGAASRLDTSLLGLSHCARQWRSVGCQGGRKCTLTLGDVAVQGVDDDRNFGGHGGSGGGGLRLRGIGKTGRLGGLERRGEKRLYSRAAGRVASRYGGVFRRAG